MKELHADWTSSDIMKHVSAKWAHMDKDEKQHYNELAAQDKARYDRELLEFTQHEHDNQPHIFELRNVRKISDV